MPAVAVAGDQQARDVVGELLEHGGALVARAVVVDPHLVVDAEAVELRRPGPHHAADGGGLVIDGHDDGEGGGVRAWWSRL